MVHYHGYGRLELGLPHLPWSSQARQMDPLQTSLAHQYPNADCGLDDSGQAFISPGDSGLFSHGQPSGGLLYQTSKIIRVIDVAVSG